MGTATRTVRTADSILLPRVPAKDASSLSDPIPFRRRTSLPPTFTATHPHCHPPSVKEVSVDHFLSEIRTENSNETPANVIRENLLKVPDSVKSSLAILNQAHEVTYIDGTFKTSPKLFKQIWIVRGHVETTCVPLMYFLI